MVEDTSLRQYREPFEVANQFVAANRFVAKLFQG